MTVTQYVGARYVPLFADPIEWSKDTAYEPLTIVIHEGNSYTSRQAVPKGIDIANDEFWALTSNYNAQVESYRKETAKAVEDASNALSLAQTNEQDIATLDSEMAGTADSGLKSLIAKRDVNIDNSRIVLIGDSYLCGVGTDPMRGWGYYFKKQLADTASVIEFGNSGAGFVAAGHTDPMSGMTFSQQVDYAASQITATDIDYVIIGGGWNDNASSYNTVFDATASCVTNARAKFPNAKIVVVSLSNELHSQTAGYINANIAIVKGAQSVGADTPDMSWMWLKANNDVTSSDKIHPNSTGYQMQGAMLASALRGSDTTPSTHMGAGFVVGESITKNTARCAIVDGICYLQGEFTSTGWSNNTTLGTLPKSMRPARSVYELAQFVGSGYKQIVPVFINADTGTIQPRTPFNGAYPENEATIYLQHISYPIGIL